MIDFQKVLAARVDRIMRNLMRHRDRYIKAWCAATGVKDPRDAVMVEQQTHDCNVKIFYMTRSDAMEKYMVNIPLALTGKVSE